MCLIMILNKCFEKNYRTYLISQLQFCEIISLQLYHTGNLFLDAFMYLYYIFN